MTTMIERLRQIFRRRRIRMLRARAKESAANALFWMQAMEDDVHQLNLLSAFEPGLRHLTELELDAALEALS